jgi:hypothetical protein
MKTREAGLSALVRSRDRAGYRGDDSCEVFNDGYLQMAV